MKKWTDEFIPGVLAGIPRSAYRSRVQAELEDHLLCLAGDLEAAGNDYDSARKKALIRMGNTAELNQRYQAGFQQWQVNSPSYHRSVLGAVSYLIPATFLAVFFAILPAFGIDTAQISVVHYGNVYHHDIIFYVTVSRIALFLLPYSLGAVYLRSSYALHPHPYRMILSGLLCGWLSTSALSLLLIYSLLGSYSCLDLPYIVATPLFCFPLAALFVPRKKTGGDPA